VARWKEGIMRVLVADSHSQVRWALRTVLGEDPSMTVIGEVSTCQGLLTQAGALEPDLILLDWELLVRPQARTLAALRRMNPHCGLIVASPRAEVREAALAAGADGFLCKCDLPGQFLANLRALVTQCETCGRKVHWQ